MLQLVSNLQKKPSNNPLGNPASDEPVFDEPASNEPASNKPSDNLAERPILNKCLSDGEKLDFLCTSIPDNNKPYYDALNIVAAMSVSFCFSLVCISLVDYRGY